MVSYEDLNNMAKAQNKAMILETNEIEVKFLILYLWNAIICYFLSIKVDECITCIMTVLSIVIITIELLYAVCSPRTQEIPRYEEYTEHTNEETYDKENSNDEAPINETTEDDEDTDNEHVSDMMCPVCHNIQTDTSCQHCGKYSETDYDKVNADRFNKSLMQLNQFADKIRQKNSKNADSNLFEPPPVSPNSKTKNYTPNLREPGHYAPSYDEDDI